MLTFWMTRHLLALTIGFCLDLLFGDPRWMPHPIRGMGWLIAKLEEVLRPKFPKTEAGERQAGTLLMCLVIGISTGLSVALLWLCGWISPVLALVVESFLCYQLLATKGLKQESMKVYDKLKEDDLPGARYAVSMIVGRDTDQLSPSGVAKAAVETVAENASDGVIAPMIFMALFGGAGGVFYKSVNTMDSMIGYKNDKYRHFGRRAALFDDLCSWIPARLSGIFMALAAFFCGLDGKEAFRIFFRDRLNHKSPNSAHTEAACAGALGVQLAGSNYYFGKLVEKPTIGDDNRPVEFEDIARSNRLMYATAYLALLLFCIFPLLPVILPL